MNTSNKKLFRRSLRKNKTPQETLLWSRLRNNQTGYKWKRQVGIGKYIADFYCSEKKLVIEIDGSQHLDAISYDEQRDIYFESLQIQTIRFYNNEVSTNIDGVLQKIMSAVESTSP